MSLTAIPRGDPATLAHRLVRAVRPACEPLPPVEDGAAFGACFDRYADARIVLLGEASHGSAEFYRARAAITRRLIAQYGYDIVAVEADWPDAARIDRYVRHRPADPHDEPAFTRFPAWMWRNEDVAAFVQWLHRHNRGLPPERRTEFRGLDVYSLRASIASVLAYLERVDPEAAAQARRRYGCLTPWQTEPAWYGRAVLRGERDPCEDEVHAQLRDILARRLEYAAQDGDDWFDAAQNARTILAAEQYYRSMFRGATESWNLRDRHMFETLQQVLRARGPDARAVVWAHNSHIGHAPATAMGWQGQFNIGELCRTAYGEAAVLIGFGTDRGTVAAADDWDEPMRVKDVLPSRADSYEQVFLQAGVPCALADLRKPANRAARQALLPPRLERAIGVVYRPDTEFHSHYFQAVLPDQFDGYVWYERTRAVTPLAAPAPHGMPDTYPFAV